MRFCVPSSAALAGVSHAAAHTHAPSAVANASERTPGAREWCTVRSGTVAPATAPRGAEETTTRGTRSAKAPAIALAALRSPTPGIEQWKRTRREVRQPHHR